MINERENLSTEECYTECKTTSQLLLDSIWCVIPIHNNGDTVKDVAERCRKQLPRVLVVDDGSRDVNVKSLLHDMDVTVLTHTHNQGKGQAILTALDYVRQQGGCYIITIDADGQHYPEDIPRFLPLLDDNTPAIIIGCRDFTADHVPGSSRFGRAFSNFWLKLETGISISDTQSGFRAYPVQYLSQLNLRGHHYDFEVEVLTRAAWAGLSIKTVDINVWYPPKEERVSSFKPFLDNVRISLIHTRLVMRRLWPVPPKRLVKRRS